MCCTDAVQAKLEALRIPLRPVEAELAPLAAPRDTLPEGARAAVLGCR